MIVELPFTYYADVIPPRARTERPKLIIERLPLKIRTAEEADFRLAFRFTEARSAPIERTAEEAARRAKEMADELRWDGSKIYAAETVGRVGGRTVPYTMTAAEIEECLLEGSGTPFAALQKVSYSYTNTAGGRAVPRDAIEGRIIRDNRRERVAEIIEAARDIVLFQGRFWVKAAEPVWQINPERRLPRVEATMGYDYQINAACEHMYRADRLEEALEAARESCGLPPHDAEVEVRGYIETLLPEAIRADLDGMQLVRQAETFLEREKRELHKASIPYFTAYATLRDALAATDRKTVTEEVAEAVRGMLGEMPDVILGDMDNWGKKDLQRAFERWRRELIRGTEQAADNAPASLPAQIARAAMSGGQR